jgi:hypothetical protein
MRKLVLVLAGLLAASLPGELVAQVQTAPPPARQRAPGVPLAPRTGEAARPPASNSVAPRDQQRGAGEGRTQAPVRPDRDPPMPKPVPSIIAP